MSRWATSWAAVAALTLYLFSSARAQQPPKPGAQTQALAQLTANFTWTGTVHEGAAGAHAPALPSHGRQRCRWIEGGLWADCQLEDTVGSGVSAMKWVGHFYYGWDFDNKAYRALGVDNFGTSYALGGRSDGKKLIFESLIDSMSDGQPIKFRFTYDLTDPKNVKFTDERSARGGPWMVGEQAVWKKSP